MQRWLISLALALVLAAPAAAQEMLFDQEPKGYASGVAGEVMILEPEAAEPRPLADSDPIFEGCRITAAQGGFAEIALLDGSVIRVDEQTQVDIEKADINLEKLFRQVDLKLLYGSVFNQVESGYEPGSRFDVTTPVAVAGVRGTEFAVAYEQEDVSDIDVFDGDVAISTPDGATAEVSGDESVAAGRGRMEKSALDLENKQNRWEYCRRALEHGRQGKSVEQLKSRIEELRRTNPNHPSLAGLQNALSRQQQGHEQMRQRMEEARRKVESSRSSRREKMREFAKKHGREKFEQARKFRGGRLSAEEIRERLANAGQRHEQAKQKLQEKRRERREKLREENRQRREGRQEKREERKDDAREKRDDRKDDVRERRDDKKGNVQEKRENRKGNIEQRRDNRKEGARDRRDNAKERRDGERRRR